MKDSYRIKPWIKEKEKEFNSLPKD